METEPTAVESDAAAWDFPTLTLIWDHRIRAIIAGADRLEALPDADRDRCVTALIEGTTAQIAAPPGVRLSTRGAP